MRYQELPYSCGAAAVVNAARCFGRRFAERSARAIAGTTEADGTAEDGIVKALAAAGLKGTPFGSPDFRFACAAIADTPAILCVQTSQHWVTVIGRAPTGRWVIIDPANTKRNMRENGVHLFDRRALRHAWVARDGLFFGILVTRP